MSSTLDSVETVSSIVELIEWVFAKVDSNDFEVWRAMKVGRVNRAVLRVVSDDSDDDGKDDGKNKDEVILRVRLDLSYPEGSPERHLYVDAKHRVNFHFLFREACRCWERGRPGPGDGNSRIAFAKIGYKGVVWQLS